MHATGNEADVTVSDLAWSVAHDPDVKLLLLYLESGASPQMLARTAVYWRERNLPIIAVKAGRSAGGQKAASSHTGSRANEDRTVDALPLAELAHATCAEVASRLPGFATATNSIDITAALLSNSGLFGDVLPALAQDPAADMFFVNIPVAGSGCDIEASARDTAAFEHTTGKPVVVAAWQASVAAPFRAKGIPPSRKKTMPSARWPNSQPIPPRCASHACSGRKARMSSWRRALPASSMRWSAWHCSASTPCRWCPCSCATAPKRPGPRSAPSARPPLIKACSSETPHKSEPGLVALNVATREQAGECFRRFRHKMGEMGRGARPRQECGGNAGLRGAVAAIQRGRGGAGAVHAAHGAAPKAPSRRSISTL